MADQLITNEILASINARLNRFLEISQEQNLRMTGIDPGTVQLTVGTLGTNAAAAEID